MGENVIRRENMLFCIVFLGYSNIYVYLYLAYLVLIESQNKQVQVYWCSGYQEYGIPVLQLDNIRVPSNHLRFLGNRCHSQEHFIAY